jgi:hypothetical protein
MKEYIEISPAEKLKLLNEHAMGTKWKSLNESKWCLHCNAQFTGRSVRVYKDEDEGPWLECGTPNCGGSPIDWANHPWWDENHQATKAFDKAQTEFEKSTKTRHPERN